ncbi:hypothetical protein BKA83DRAFT_4597434 [Pisolithus microcarpus]|nr:hypothetical protein BKA83DRAFT_4597434 [Pisolithus microcarpus]
MTSPTYYLYCPLRWKIALLPGGHVPSQTSVETRAQTPRAATLQAATSRATSPRAMTPRAITPRAQGPRGQTPAPAAREKPVAIRFPSPGSSESEGSPAPSESSLSSLESGLGENDKFSKPSGEAGRPGRGGYNLEEQLSWGGDGFKSLKVSIY